MKSNQTILPNGDQIDIETEFGRVNVFVEETGYLCVTIEDSEMADLNLWVGKRKVRL